MEMPKYSDIYPYFLKTLLDGKEHRLKDIVDEVTMLMNISEETQNERLKSGKKRFYNNVSWASTYLKKAGLIESSRRGYFQLSDLGVKSINEENLLEVDNDFLRKYDDFNLFVEGDNEEEKEDMEERLSEHTPLEKIESAVKQLERQLQDELLQEILNQPPDFFENLVVTLLVKMGYGGSLEDAGTVLGKSGDEGIDGIIKEDKLGFDSIYIQAKRWSPENTVGRPEIQKFVGALAGQGARKGLFITTSRYTAEAYSYSEQQHSMRVVLVDGQALTKLMIEHGIGVEEQAVYRIMELDTDFFNGEFK